MSLNTEPNAIDIKIKKDSSKSFFSFFTKKEKTDYSHCQDLLKEKRKLIKKFEESIKKYDEGVFSGK